MALTSFASRTPAAYIQGTTFEGNPTTSEMLHLAGLDNWNVHLRPVVTDAWSAKESFEVLRTNPAENDRLERLGISGERYHEIQNENAFGMFDDLNPTWDAAGSFKHGTLVYGQATTDKSIVIDPNGSADEVKPLLVISTGHGGTGALRIGRTAQRMECLNMFNLIFGKSLQHAITIKHTKSAADRMKAIKLFWKTNNLYYDVLAQEANALHAQAATDKDFWSIVNDGFLGERPDDANVKGALTKWENKRETFASAWNGPTNESAKGTAWGVFNAIIEANQWGRTIQKTDNGVDNFAMAGMGFDIPTNNVRQAAYEAARSLVTV